MADRLAVGVVLSALVYIALGLWLKAVVLNWIVGPLWLLGTLYLLPLLVATVTSRRGGSRRGES